MLGWYTKTAPLNVSDVGFKPLCTKQTEENRQNFTVWVSLFLLDFRGLVVVGALSKTETDKCRLGDCECTCVWFYHVIYLNTRTPKLITEKKCGPCSLTVLLSWDWQAACRARLASNHNKRTKKSKKSLKNQEFQKKFDNVLKSLCISIRKEDLQSSHDIGFEGPEFGQVSVSLFKCTTKYPLYLRKLQPINFLLVSTTYLPLFCFIFWCTKAIEMLWPYFTSLLLLTFHFLNIPHFSK